VAENDPTSTHTETLNVSLSVPDGWILSGEYRRPRSGEFFLSYRGVGQAPANAPMLEASAAADVRVPILIRRTSDTIFTEPLNVRVARALGDDVTRRHERSESAEGYSACTWCGQVRSWSEEFRGPCIRPYGDDSPAGWACTGPLINRLGLRPERFSSWAIAQCVAQGVKP
jgi:hypothetical protein